MGKGRFGIVAAVIGILLIVGGFLLANSKGAKGLEWNSRWNWDVTVKDGVADPKYTNGNFTVDQAGTYTLHLTWDPKGPDESDGKTGFVTGCAIMDEKAHLIYASSDIQGDVSPELELKAGNYHLDYWYLTTKEDFVSFAKKWICGQYMTGDLAEQYPFRDFAKDGTWNVGYTLHAEKKGSFNLCTAAAHFAVIIGAVLVVLALVLVVKRRGLLSHRYDERQELEQGRGFRYAFFTFLVSVGVVLMLDSTGAAAGKGFLFYAACIFISLTVYAIYCIWHDCYIALNEKRGASLAVLGAIGAVNLVIGLSSTLSNGFYDDSGRISVSVLNLMCAATMLVIVIAGVIRSIIDRHEVAKEEDEA